MNNVLQLMTRVLGATFAGETWATWRAVLKAAHRARPHRRRARSRRDADAAARRCPPSPVRELWLLLGRRVGQVASSPRCSRSGRRRCRTYTLAPGEVGVFMVIAADRKQARVIKRYVAGLLRVAPVARSRSSRSETPEAIWLTNGLCIEIHTCSFRSLRGYTCIGAAVRRGGLLGRRGLARTRTSEVLVALRAAMASVPEAMLIGLTSVYARRGEVWRIFEKHFGRNESRRPCSSSTAPRPTMNPTISRARHRRRVRGRPDRGRRGVRRRVPA